MLHHVYKTKCLHKKSFLAATHWKILLLRPHMKISAGLYFNYSVLPTLKSPTTPVRSNLALAPPAACEANSSLKQRILLSKAHILCNPPSRLCNTGCPVCVSDCSLKNSEETTTYTQANQKSHLAAPALLHSAPASSLPCQLPFTTEQPLFSKAFHSHGSHKNHFPKFRFISFYFLLLLL